MWGANYQRAPAGRQKYLLPFRSLCVYVCVCVCVRARACVLNFPVFDSDVSVFDMVAAAGVFFSGQLDGPCDPETCMSGIASHHAAFDNGVIHFVRTEKCLKHRRKRHTARGTEV